MSKWITIGKIVSIWGKNEGFVVYPMTDNLERFNALNYIFVQKENEEPRKIPVKEIFYKKNTVVVKVKFDKTLSLKEFVGNFLVISEDMLPSLPDGEYYVYRLIGLKVFTEEGEFIGKVKDIMPNPAANDVIVVSREGEKDLLLPFIKEILVEIDLKNKKMILKKIWD
ncbi:MAG: 16S rRNA processing protein RimM [Caldisericia bacterium]|nr:16S rRNA processing protein RimM [Caldisericia bacterium]